MAASTAQACTACSERGAWGPCEACAAFQAAVAQEVLSSDEESLRKKQRLKLQCRRGRVQDMASSLSRSLEYAHKTCRRVPGALAVLSDKMDDARKMMAQAQQSLKQSLLKGALPEVPYSFAECQRTSAELRQLSMELRRANTGSAVVDADGLWV